MTAVLRLPLNVPRPGRWLVATAGALAAFGAVLLLALCIWLMGRVGSVLVNAFALVETAEASGFPDRAFAANATY